MHRLDDLRAKIPVYADYRDQEARHLVDKQVRAYVGEALSALRERLAPRDAASDQLERVLLRCEFSDQRVIAATDRSSFEDEALVARIHDLDWALLDAADRAATVDAAVLPQFLTELEVLFEQRFGAISTAPLR